MPHRIPQSIALRVPLKAYLSSDHISDATGKSLVVQISKNGVAFGNPSAGATNATEIASGWYYVDLSATDTNTLGPLVVRSMASGVDPVEIAYQVVDATNMGASNLDVTVSSRNAIAPPTVTQIRTEMDSNSTKLANLDVAVSSRSTFSGGAVASVTAGVTVADKTGFSLATAPPTAAQIRTEMDSNSTKLANLDVAVSTRNATVPDNTSVASILAMLQDATYGLNALLTAISSSGSGLTAAAIRAEIDSNSTTLASLLSRLSALRAGYLDNLAEAPPTAAAINTALSTAHGPGAWGAGTAADPWAAVEPVSGKTYGELAGKLYVPGSDAPVVVIPANPDPDVQVVHFFGLVGDNSKLVGKMVSASPLPGQTINSSLIAKQKLLSPPLDANGYTTLTLIRGIRYKVLADWWDITREITVTNSANATFRSYCLSDEVVSYDMVVRKGFDFATDPPIKVTDEAGEPLDLTQYIIYFFTQVPGVQYIGSAGGEIIVSLAGSISESLAVGEYPYLLRIDKGGENPRDLLSGMIVITE